MSDTSNCNFTAPTPFDVVDNLRGLVSEAFQDVLNERLRQIYIEKWTPEHDDEHGNGEMAQAAACYADPKRPMRSALDLGPESRGTRFWFPRRWPWAVHWWKPKSRRRDLVRAAALILAEIERLDRAVLKAAAKGKS